MRELVYQTLMATNALFPLLGNPPRVYQMGSLGVGFNEARPDFPYLLISEQPATVNQEVRKTSPKSHNRTFFLYCHDQHGEGYQRIEQILRIARDTLLGLIGTKSPTGAQCTDVTWTGLSVDSKDPEYVSNMKFASFRFVTSE